MYFTINTSPEFKIDLNDYVTSVMRTDGSIPLIPFGLFRAPDIFLNGQTVQRFVIFYMRFNCDHKFLIPSILGATTFFRNQRSLPVTLLKHRNHAFLILYAFYFILFYFF